MNSSRFALIPIAISALILLCVPTRVEALQCKIDVVFLLDVSSSMDDEIDALCTKINSVAGLLAAHNVDTRYEIFALHDGRTSCSEKTTRTQFGDERDGVRSIEDWGRGVSVVAVKHDWRDDVVKLVVPISDEGPSEGDPIDQEDEDVIEQAIGWAKNKGVVVSPIVGTDASEDVFRLAEKIAGATEGKAFRSIQPDEDMFDGIFEQIQQACLVQQVQIPDVIGLSREQAVARLSEAGLTLRRASDEPSSQPPGSIFDQDPPAGTTVKVDTPVDVVLARGVGAPDVSGLSRKEALARLNEAGLELGRVTNEPSSRPPGSISGQDPPAGTTVPLGTAVNVVVAQGVEVPDVSGLNREQALARLSEAGLELGRVADEPSSQPPGSIFGQDPPAGTTASLGTKIHVVAAQGVMVPDVSGLSRDQVQSRLTEMGLNLGRVADEPSSQPLGTILSQEPPVGMIVSLGTTIDLVAAQGVEVPNVSGLSREQAVARLSEVGLELGRVDSEPSARGPGRILGQNPPGGTIVPLGTTVSLKAGVIPWVELSVAVAAFLILILLVGFYAHKRRSRRRGRLEFFLGKDLGIQHLEPRVSTPSNIDVRIRVVRQRGQHTIEAEAPMELDE